MLDLGATFKSYLALNKGESAWMVSPLLVWHDMRGSNHSQCGRRCTELWLLQLLGPSVNALFIARSQLRRVPIVSDLRMRTVRLLHVNRVITNLP